MIGLNDLRDNPRTGLVTILSAAKLNPITKALGLAYLNSLNDQDIENLKNLFTEVVSAADHGDLDRVRATLAKYKIPVQYTEKIIEYVQSYCSKNE